MAVHFPGCACELAMAFDAELGCYEWQLAPWIAHPEQNSTAAGSGNVHLCGKCFELIQSADRLKTL